MPRTERMRRAEELQLSAHGGCLQAGLLAFALASCPHSLLCTGCTLPSTHQPEGSCRTGIGGVLLLCSKLCNNCCLTWNENQ